MDVTETDKAYEIAAELPGMSDKNVEVKLADGVLTIKGEKQEEKEEKKKDYYLHERNFGSFQRAFQVPDGVDADKIEASFKNGVLTVTLPKSAQAQKTARRSTSKLPDCVLRTDRPTIRIASNDAIRVELCYFSIEHVPERARSRRTRSRSEIIGLSAIGATARCVARPASAHRASGQCQATLHRGLSCP